MPSGPREGLCSTESTGQEVNGAFAPIFSVRLVRESEIPIPATVRSPADAAHVLCSFFEGADREKFVLLMLATNGSMIGLNVVSIGTLDASLVSMRETFKPALLANAASIIVAHNHPSGNLDPSPQDVAITRKLTEAGRLLDIPVKDHLIVGFNGAYASLAERGLM